MDLTYQAWAHQVEDIENVFVPMADGTRLAAKVLRPVSTGAVPAILEYLPDRKREGSRRGLIGPRGAFLPA